MTKKINRKAMYDALARHTQAYPDFVGDTAARIDGIMAIKINADAKMDLIDAALKADEDVQAVSDNNNNLAALLPVWEQELIEEKAGHNRDEVIAELEANILKAKAV